MKSLLKVAVVGSAMALAAAMIPSTSFAGERFNRGGRHEDGWAVFGRVVTAPFCLAATVVDRAVPRVVVGGPAYCGPAPVPCAPVAYGYCGPTVVVRPEARYCAPAHYYGYRGYYGYCR